MTFTSAPTPTSALAPASPPTTAVTGTSSMAALRRVLQADAALCVASGALLVGGAAPLADLADVDTSWPIAAAGAFLLVLAGGLVVLSRAVRRHVLALVPWSAAGDAAWAAASVAVAVGVSMNGTGRVLVLAQAAVVAAMSVVKLRSLRAARWG